MAAKFKQAGVVRSVFMTLFGMGLMMGTIIFIEDLWYGRPYWNSLLNVIIFAPLLAFAALVRRKREGG